MNTPRNPHFSHDPPRSEAVAIKIIVQEHPGANLKQAQEQSGLTRHSFRTAVYEAIHAGWIHEIAHGREKLLIPKHPDFPDANQAARQIGALRDPRTRSLYERLCEDPEFHDRQEIHRWAKQTHGLEPTDTRWALDTLRDADLLKTSKPFGDQRRVALIPRAAHPTILHAAD